jgi:nucleoside-diphosphate-sugar epimerase
MILQTYSNFRKNQIRIKEFFIFAELTIMESQQMTKLQTAGPYNPRILLTGGSGFLGRAIVKELLAPGSPLTPSMLRIFDLSGYTGPSDERIEIVTSDIRDASAVNEACRNIDLVIHSAAIVDWGTMPEQEVLSVNFGGTENVVRACHEQGVRHLVYTSSLDAVFEGKSLVDIDETIPYPRTHPNMYCRSKYLSEKLVLGSNGTSHPVSRIQHPESSIQHPVSSLPHPESHTLTTCVLRPSDIYGEGDPYHIDSLINMAKGGFYVRLGNGSSKSQHVYAGNMAWAHVLAAKSLLEGNPAVAGNAYFITDGPAANFFTFFDRIVEGAGYRIWPKNIWIPRRIAYVMGMISEGIAWMARPFKKYAPKFSRFAVIYTCSDFTFTAAKAYKDFGFEPKYSAEEAFRLTVEYYQKKGVNSQEHISNRKDAETQR